MNVPKQRRISSFAWLAVVTAAACSDITESEDPVVQSGPFRVLEWNITGSAVTANRTILEGVFASEDADIIVLQETGRGAGTISGILVPEYSLVAALNGQDIWVRNNDRFNVVATGQHAFPGGCNGNDLGSSSVGLEDMASDGRLLYVYSSHFCILDGFGGSVDPSPEFSNENQQEHMCALMGGVEEAARNGTALIAADFNSVDLAAGESLVAFLDGSGSLNAGFCESTDVGMREIGLIDVTRIVGSGSASLYSDPHSVSRDAVGFGQHGYVVTSVDLGMAGG